MRIPQALSGARCYRLLAELALCASTLLAGAVAEGAALPSPQPLQVIAVNENTNQIDALTLSSAGQLTTPLTPLNTDGATYETFGFFGFDSLAFVPAASGALNIAAVSRGKGDVVLYSPSGSPPSYSTGTVLYSSKPVAPAKTPPPGPAYPFRVAADGAGNLFVLSRNCPQTLTGVTSCTGTHALWVDPYNQGSYSGWVLVDSTFGSANPGFISEVIVLGSAAANGAWNQGDIAVVVSLPQPQVLIYSHSSIYTSSTSSTIKTPATATSALVTGPTSTAITPANFGGILKANEVVLSADLWAGDPNQTSSNVAGVGLLFSTSTTCLIRIKSPACTPSARIIRWDSSGASTASGAAGFAKTDFADGLPAQYAQRLRTGAYPATSSTPSTLYAFLAEPTLTWSKAGGLTVAGSILEFGDAQQGTSNTPETTFTQTGFGPGALAVTGITSTPVAECTNGTCAILPGSSSTSSEATLNIQCPISGAPSGTVCQISTNAPNANILTQTCAFEDPRVSTTDGWSCSGGTLPVNSYCPNLNMPAGTSLPGWLCGHSGATGNYVVIAAMTAPAVAQNSSNSLYSSLFDATVVEPSTTYDLLCSNYPNIPLIAYAPSADDAFDSSVNVTGSTARDITALCSGDPPQGKSNDISNFFYGIGFNQSGLPASGKPSITALQNYFDTEYEQMYGVVANATTISTAFSFNGAIVNVQAVLEGDINSSQGAFDLGEYSNAMACLVQTVNDVTTYLGGFTTGTNIANVPGYLISQAETVAGQTNNWYLNAAPFSTWASLAASVGQCQQVSNTLTASNPYTPGYIFEAADLGDTIQAESLSYGTQLDINWSVTRNQTCSLYDSDGVFYSSTSPLKVVSPGVTGTGTVLVSYPAGQFGTLPHQVIWTLSCPDSTTTTTYYVDSPGSLAGLSASGTVVPGTANDLENTQPITLSWSFTDFPPAATCALSSTDPAFTPQSSLSISSGGGFSGPTVGSDPVTSGTGSYTYTPGASDSGTFTATLNCNGITSSGTYEVSPPPPALNIAYYTISVTDPDPGTLGSGNCSDYVASSLGTDGLPVVNPSWDSGCGTSPAAVAGSADVNGSGEIEWWSPALDGNVTYTGTAVVNLPFDTGPGFYPPNGAGQCDGTSNNSYSNSYNSSCPAGTSPGYQAAVLSGQLIVVGEGQAVTFTVGADDMAFVYLDGNYVCGQGGVHGYGTPTTCTTASPVSAGVHTLQVFYTDINIVQARFSFNVTASNIVVVP